MKSIEIDEEIYQYIASNTKFIGESASSILRRLLALESVAAEETIEAQPKTTTIKKDKVVVKPKPAQTTKAQNQTSDIDDKANAENASSVTSGQSIFDLINKEELAMQRGAVGRFLLILSNLYRVHPNQFSAVLDIRGRDRLYFAESENELLENGHSTKPKQIPETNYWVTTNSNTTRKKLMLTDVANVLGYTSEEAEIIRDFL
ncbi:replication initiation negative regulator SeqA [Thalassomonas sp. M1454]|uniref:replication initiation negative regulator SeqA n=1 Tax=Thalassomonas sp. M1454 TaxID=2594477 RepID=UPI00117E7D08|nr:replication initiation negative regulator SeqA [Thalassomonas sp. M1454]TRX56584.1 replication initiation negative regulator SeqA [Thalassomonas sp. M1454]